MALVPRNSFLLPWTLKRACFYSFISFMGIIETVLDLGIRVKMEFEPFYQSFSLIYFVISFFIHSSYHTWLTKVRSVSFPQFESNRVLVYSWKIENLQRINYFSIDIRLPTIKYKKQYIIKWVYRTVITRKLWTMKTNVKS